MISSISLHEVLPEVFVSAENEAGINTSEIWLGDVTFTRGNRYLIEATSGAGKSSLCSFIYGARFDYKGEITFDGKNVRRFSSQEWSRLRSESLAYLPQQLMLFPELTVLENIEIKNRLTRFKTRSQIISLLDELGVGEKLTQPAARLSVGQQQRVAIVRAVCQPFSFLLLDEPVSHLDAHNNASAAAILQREAGEQGAAIVATTVGNTINIDDFISIKL